MREFTEGFKRTFLYIVLWGLLTSGSAFAAGKTPYGYGLLLGTLASILCFLHLYYQVHKCAAMSSELAAAYVQAGWVVRLSVMLLVLTVSMILPGISFIAALTGFFSVQIVLLLGAFMQLIKGQIIKQ